MDHFNLTYVKYIVLTFENLEQCKIGSDYLNSLEFEQTKWPNMTVFDHVPYSTIISINKGIYQNQEVYNRICQYRDITWVDVVFYDGRESQYIVPWDDDKEYEDENKLQTTFDNGNGVTIKVHDYIEVS